MRFIVSVFIIFTLFTAIFAPLGHAYAAGKKSGGDGASEYVKLAPLLLPIIDEDGIQQVVSMVVAIEVDGIHVDQIKKVTPRLTDAYIQDMYGVLNRHAALKGGIIQIGVIKDRLNEITHEVLGDEIDTQVLLQHVQQRPI